MYLLLAIHIAWTLGAVPLVTRQKRLPASAAAWLALILLLPVAGTLLYILAGYRPHLPAAERRAYRGDRLGQIIARGCGTRSLSLSLTANSFSLSCASTEVF